MYVEAVLSAIDALGNLIVQPIGTTILDWKGAPHIGFRVFPRTRLYELIWYITDLCIAEPIKPRDMVSVVLNPTSIELVEGVATHSPCLRDAVWRVEATVKERLVTDQGLVVVVIEPVYVAVDEFVPVFVRGYGCLIELLVWYTRALAAVRYVERGVEARGYWCRRLKRYVRALPATLECVKHTLRGDLVGKAERVACRLLTLHFVAGCPPPEDLEEQLALECPPPQLSP